MIKSRILFQKKAREIWNLQKVNVNAFFSASTTSPSPSDFELQQSHIDEAVKLNPILGSTSLEVWERTHSIFRNHGLPTTNFLRIVVGNTSVLTRSPQKIITNLEYWRSCQFGEKLLHLLLTKYPEFLDITDGMKLITHITYIKGFACTDRNVWKLLMNCPDLVQQPVDLIEPKITYLKDKMRIDIPEIVKSEALSSTLEDIRIRHTYLLRLGLFKPRPLKSNPDEPTKNHRLYQITDSSDKSFATKLCHTTLEEYEAFKDLYSREMLNEEDELLKEEDDFSDDE